MAPEIVFFLCTWEDEGCPEYYVSLLDKDVTLVVALDEVISE